MTKDIAIDMSGAQPTIDAKDLSALLDLPPEEVLTLMRAGKITTRYETGVGEDAGKIRLTFFHASRRVRLTCSAAGDVLKISRVRMEQK